MVRRRTVGAARSPGIGERDSLCRGATRGRPYRRRITIPPMLGYGKRGAGGVIGPDETLVFVVDLIGVR